MKLYNPPNVALPAFKIAKGRERQAMEDDATVNNVIRSNLLLDAEFNTLYIDVLKKSKLLLRTMRLTDDELLHEYTFFSRSLGFPRKSMDREWVLTRLMMLRRRSGRIRKIKKEVYDEMFFKIIKDMYTDIGKYSVKLSNQMQNSISAFEEKKKVELPIFSSTTMYVCKKCARIISLDKFTPCTCACGERITRIAKIKQIPIRHFNNRLISFLERNYWLEHGVDYLLRRKNLQTLVGYHVLGHSGVWHEIDNIADSKRENYRFFGECKNAEVTVNDIFVFSGKMVDVGGTRGYVFTTSEKVSDDMVRLARSRNIDIVPGVLTRESTALLEDIREG